MEGRNSLLFAAAELQRCRTMRETLPEVAGRLTLLLAEGRAKGED